MDKQFAEAYRKGECAGFKGESPEALKNSREAAEEVTETLGRRHAQVLAAFQKYGATGAIPEDIAADLELQLHIIRPRCGELRKRGMLHEVGRRMGGLGCKVMAYSVIKPVEVAA